MWLDDSNQLISYAVKMYSIHAKYDECLSSICNIWQRLFRVQMFSRDVTRVQNASVYGINRTININSYRSREYSRWSPINAIDNQLNQSRLYFVYVYCLDFHFEPYIAYLRTNDASLSSTTNCCPLVLPSVNQLLTNTTYEIYIDTSCDYQRRLCLLSSYSIDDLLTPTSSLNNGELTPALNNIERNDLIGHCPHANSTRTLVAHPLSTLDPLHGLLLGNTTAFDTISTQQHIEHDAHVSSMAIVTTGIQLNSTSSIRMIRISDRK
jgi:hypothetical protein